MVVLLCVTVGVSQAFAGKLEGKILLTNSDNTPCQFVVVFQINK